jgi:hypothetical protein
VLGVDHHGVIDRQRLGPSVTVSLPPGPHGDIGYLLKYPVSPLPPEQRYQLLISEFQPSIPERRIQKERRFRPEWLKDVRYSNWLFYTQYAGGGAICKQCILAKLSAGRGSIRSRIDQAASASAPFTTRKNFVAIASRHMESVAHKDAVVLNNEFKQSFEKGVNDVKISTVSQITIEHNCATMKSVVDSSYVSCKTRFSVTRG